MNLDKMDRIVFKDQSEIDKLLKWRDINKDLVRNFNPVLEEGVIVHNQFFLYFKQTHDFVSYNAYIGDRHEAKMIIHHDNDDGTYRVMEEWFNPIVPKEQHKDYIQDMATIHMSMMAYMEHYTEYITERKETSVKIKKGKGGNKNKNRTVKIGRKVYDVNIPSSVLTEKRNYERHTETWTQRGHWRTIKKSGKRIWIDKQVKGDKTKKPDPKTYRI